MPRPESFPSGASTLIYPSRGALCALWSPRRAKPESNRTREYDDRDRISHTNTHTHLVDPDAQTPNCVGAKDALVLFRWVYVDVLRARGKANGRDRDKGFRRQAGRQAVRREVYSPSVERTGKRDPTRWMDEEASFQVGVNWVRQREKIRRFKTKTEKRREKGYESREQTMQEEDMTIRTEGEKKRRWKHERVASGKKIK